MILAWFLGIGTVIWPTGILQALGPVGYTGTSAVVLSSEKTGEPENGFAGDSLGVVVVAAGRSTRMGGTDKTFADIHGKPLIAHTLSRLADCDAVSRIALVVAAESVDRATSVIDGLRIEKIAAVCAGGERRQDSVYAGMLALGESRWVAVHDGARPCVSGDMMARALDAVRQWGAAVAAVPVKDTIKVVGADSVISDTPERATLWAAQTPQVFDYRLLMCAHRAASADYTDDAAMVEAMGHAVRVFRGSYDNVKVTTPEDIAVVSHYLADGNGGNL